MTIMGERHETALLSIRKRSGKTQLVVANALGLSKSTYSAWETGRISLNTEHIISLCDYFGCTPNELLGYDASPKDEDDARTYMVLDAEEVKLVDLFSKLAPNNRASVLDLMQSCTKLRRPRIS